MGYGAQTIFTHINNGASTFLEKDINGVNTFFIHFHALFFILDTVCADNKDNLMADCKNQLIKKLLTFIILIFSY